MKKGRKNLITCDASMNIWVIIRKKINIKHFSKICTIIKEKKIQECFIKTFMLYHGILGNWTAAQKQHANDICEKNLTLEK